MIAAIRVGSGRVNTSVRKIACIACDCHRIKKAAENNLKNIDVTLPRDKFIVLTGLSGSGKSSLAFDTIYAEGQRRYMESLSSYARQFLGQMEKPNVEKIEDCLRQFPSIRNQQTEIRVLLLEP